MASTRRTRKTSRPESPAGSGPARAERRAARRTGRGLPRPLLVAGLGALVVVVALGAALLGGGQGAPGSPGGATESPVAGSPGATTNGLPLEVSVARAAELRAGGAFVLDVREPDEWAAGHIPEATLIPLGQLAARAAEVPRDRDVVVVCRSGNRSAQGRDLLRAAGLASVTSMAGGMNDWSAAGLPTVAGE